MTAREDVFQHAMNQGHSAAWDQMWDRAAQYYRQALAEFPDHPQALTNLGLALIELQQFDEALRCYIRAAKSLPDDPLPLEKIAQLSERLGNLEQASQAALRSAELYLKNRDISKAIENWERVTRLKPENLQAHSRLALVFEKLGDKQKAVAEYISVASLLQEIGELEKAMRALSQALKVIPNSDEVIQAITLLKDYKPLPKPVRPRGSTAPLRMSQVRQLQAPQTADDQPKLDPVAQACNKALTILAGMLFDVMDEDQPGDQTERRGLQEIVMGAGMPHKSSDRTRMMLHLSQLIDLQTNGKYSQAAEELQRAIDAGLENPAAFFDLGFLHMQSGRLESAQRQLQNAVKHADFALGTRLLLGDLLSKKGQIKEACLQYLEALKLADIQAVPAEQANDLRQLYEPIIESQRHEKDLQAQQQLCDTIRSMLMRPDWRAHLRQTRTQMLAGGEGMPPIPLAEMMTQSRSGVVIESIATIYELLNAGKIRSAMEEAYYTLQNAPTYLPLHSLMAEMLVKQGDLASAVAKFQVVARAYSVRGEAQQAINYYRKIVDLSPVDLNARRQLIDQLIAFGRTSEAINEYLQLADVYYSLADLSMARKTQAEALRVAQQANEDRAVRVKILHRMADIDLQSLEWRQALRIFDQIRTLQPEDEQARSNLITLNFRMGQEQQALSELDNYIAYLNASNQGQKAQKYLEELLDQYHDKLPLRRRLAEQYRQMGLLDQAIFQYDAIGEKLLQSGDRAAAIQTIEIILSLNPTNKADYQTLLEQLHDG